MAMKNVPIGEVLKEYGINSNIKWPNDVVVNLQNDGVSGEKICGILAETATISNQFNCITIISFI